MAKIAVYCGSSTPTDAALLHQAHAIGGQLAHDGHTLIYGGSANGLMGQVASGAHNAGGAVLGYVPVALQRKELPLASVLLHQCETVGHRMAAFRTADAHLVLPGGSGTAEEFFHIFNSLCFGQWNLPLEEALSPRPLAMVADNDHMLHLWKFLEAGVQKGLVDATVAQATRFAPWEELRGWLNAELAAKA